MWTRTLTYALGRKKEKLNLDSTLYCYCILGKVIVKAASLHYLDNWMKCYELLDDFLQDIVLAKVYGQNRQKK